MSAFAELSWLWPIAAAPLVGAVLTLLVHRLPEARPSLAGFVRGPGAPSFVDAVAARAGLDRGLAAGILAAFLSLAAVGVAAWAAVSASGALLWASCVLGWLLLALAVIDLRHLLLPDALTLPLMLAGVMASYSVAPDRLEDHLLGAVFGFVSFALMRFGYRLARGREGIGQGDVKLMAAIGAWVGWQGLSSVVLVAAAAGLAVALAGAVTGRGARLDRPLPFGAYLSLAAWLIWLYGPVALG